MAPIGAKLRQNAFRTICNFRFFDAKKILLKTKSISEIGFSQFSAARLVLMSKSDSWKSQAAGPRQRTLSTSIVLGGPFLFGGALIIRGGVFNYNSGVVYPPRMAPIGVKLWENAFQTICNISFFDVRKKFWMKFFRKNKKWRKINK